MKALLSRIIKQLLHNRGWELRRWPNAFLEEPSSQLTLSIELLALHLAIQEPDLCFLQVGAHDGLANDPLYNIIQKFNWRGILIEPQRDAFSRLQKNYGDNTNIIFKNIAISNKDGLRDFFRINPSADVPSWVHQLASFDKGHILKHKCYYPGLENLIICEKIQCLTFETLLREIGFTKIDVLQIDAEGYDGQILKMFDFALHQPSIVSFEHRHLPIPEWNECINLLISHSYRVGIAGPDTLAYRDLTM